MLPTLPGTHEISKELLRKDQVRGILVVAFRQLSVNGFVCECVSDFCRQLRGTVSKHNHFIY
jgi:hypothetical protein